MPQRGKIHDGCTELTDRTMTAILGSRDSTAVRALASPTNEAWVQSSVGVAGFARVMENLESHEFNCWSLKVMEN